MKINRSLVERIREKLGYETLNRIQEAMLEYGTGNSDIVLYSPTGSGKTAAFLLTSLHYFRKNISGVQALTIVPTRELALQIEKVFGSMDTGYKVNSCYGGHALKTELNNFKEPPALLVGTPGRIADHLRRGSFNTENIKILILDEFDKSLEMGFGTEMQDITSRLKNVKKRILTSASRAIEIPEYTGIINEEFLDFTGSEYEPEIKFKAIRAKKNDKLEALKNLIGITGNEPALIFCNHREAVERISKLLDESGILHDLFHGGLDQEERERSLVKFRNGSLRILVTTDLAARGLDIPEIKNIIHYQLPDKKKTFVHRNGRTARMKTAGTAWLVLSETEPLPAYIEGMVEFVEPIEERATHEAPEWATLYFGGGKKNKIGKIDIVGLLIRKGELEKDDIGLISIQDFASYAAVKRDQIRHTLRLIKGQRLKGKKIKIDFSM